MRIGSNLYHIPVWSKMVNILSSKQDTKLIPMALLSSPDAPGSPCSYIYHYFECGEENPSPYDNKSRSQKALYVFSSDQIPYYEAINIWCKL